MTNPFQNINDVLSNTGKEAARLMGKEINIEHLMLGLLRTKDEQVNNILTHFGINIEMLQSLLDESQRNDDIHVSTKEYSEQDINHFNYDSETSKVIKDSVLEAKLCNGHTALVEPEHILLAILKQRDCDPARLLTTQGLTYDKVFHFIKGEDVEEELKLMNLDDQVNRFKEQMAQNQAKAEEEEKRSQDADEYEDEGDLGVINPPKDQDLGDVLDPDDEPLDFSDNQGQPMGKSKQQAAAKATKTKTPMLNKFGHDLTKAAMDGALDPVVGREKEIRRVMEILGRRKKNNPVLIGEPGVGKSAIVEGLAQIIKGGESTSMFFNKRLISLDMTSIVAGTKYRGEFEARIKGVIKELQNNPDIIIFIDEIHTLVGAGSAEGTMDAANILKPALARGEIQCIGATTLDEYRKSIEKDGALERRFQKVMVDPTTAEETLEVLNNIKGKYEEHHNVIYDEDAIEACVKLTERYVNGRFFPDKAIDVLDEVGSRVHISNATVPEVVVMAEKELEEIIDKKQDAVACQNFEMAATLRDLQAKKEQDLDLLRQEWQHGDPEHRVHVTAKEVADVVSQMTGIPVQRMAEAETLRLKNMGNVLKGEVIAQDNAIEKTVKAIQRNRMGLRDPNHPIGVFMFLGPTGIGKTYLAKKLAEEIFGSADSLIRIDMSEYSESFNTSRLLGAPPGYVGYNEGGLLTEKVRRKPYSIVLLDEIEKANSKVFNMLLQVLDDGRLTDGNGRLVDFRNTIIIMTSNAGTRQLKDFGRGVGFNAGGTNGGNFLGEKDKEYARGIVQKSLAKQFPPEFLNRMDEIITFDQLDLAAIKKIVDLELKSLIKRVEAMGYHFQITDKAKEFVATKGYDVQFGARPLKRAIQTYVEDGLCDLLLGGTLKSGDTINIGKCPGKDELSFNKKQE